MKLLHYTLLFSIITLLSCKTKEEPIVCDQPKEAIEITGSFIDWGGKANDNITNDMLQENSCTWSFTFSVTNDESVFKPSWLADMAPNNAVNAAFRFRTGKKFGNQSGAAGPDFGVENDKPNVLALGQKLQFISNATDGGAYNAWITIEKGKTYKISIDMKTLEVNFVEIIAAK
jgi:hypothetical protein